MNPADEKRLAFRAARAVMRLPWLPGRLRDWLERWTAYEVVARSFNPSLPPLSVLHLLGRRAVPFGGGTQRPWP